MNNLIKRYTYQVGRYLPYKQRDDIVEELNSVLHDMISHNSKDEDVITVIKEFGSPREVAAKYNPQGQYLIGPILFPIYRLVLFIAIGAVILGIIINTIASSFTYDMTIGSLLMSSFGSLFSGLLSAFGSVTLVFALTQRYLLKEEEKEIGKEWDPRKLPKIPLAKAEISLLKIGLRIFIHLVFLIIILLYPERIGIFFFNKETVTHIPLLNMDVFSKFIPFFVTIFVLNILHNIFLIKRRYWTKRLRIGKILIEIYNIVLLIVFLSNSKLIASNFMEKVEAIAPRLPDVLNIFLKVSIGLLFFSILFATVKEIYNQIRNMETS